MSLPLGNRREPVQVQAFVSERAVERLDVGIVGRSSRPREIYAYLVMVSPEIAALAAEDEEIANMRVAVKAFLDLQRKPVHAAAHVGVPGGQPHAHVRGNGDHLSARRAAVNSGAGAEEKMLMRTWPSSTRMTGSCERTSRRPDVSASTTGETPPPRSRQVVAPPLVVEAGRNLELARHIRHHRARRKRRREDRRLRRSGPVNKVTWVILYCYARS
jgi:hypothetical protein